MVPIILLEIKFEEGRWIAYDILGVRNGTKNTFGGIILRRALDSVSYYWY